MKITAIICIMSAQLWTCFSLTGVGQAEVNTARQTEAAGSSKFAQILALKDANPSVASIKSSAADSCEESVKAVNARAQYTLGLAYLEGKGKPLNCMEAAHWFELAAKQGLPEAQYQLGMLYEKGRGVPQDYKKAASWYKLSVRQDFVPAQNALGFLYYNGKGVPRDLVISLALFNIAAAAGHADAFQNTYIAASTMSHQGFNQAKTLAANRKQLYKMIGG